MYRNKRCAKIEELIGKTFTAVRNSDNELTFITDDDKEYLMYHAQDCCESVYLEDVCGDLDDLVGSPILHAEESSSSEHPDDRPKPEYSDDSFTWTFYKLGTMKGYVTLRWYGSSNGYYSESVDLYEMLE